MTEHELGAIVEGGYLGYGASNVIHFFGVTPMDDPNLCVPTQYTSRRPVQAGDVLFTEITAIFWGYSGQVLRTYTIEAEPTPLYSELHGVAEATFDAIVGVLKDGATAEQVVAASSIIEDAGFTIWDDLIHGFGGGYLPPVLGTKSRANAPVPDFTFRSGMCYVVQPNIVTRDHKAGVQTGECVVITDSGVESLHNVPRGMLQLSNTH
jgi:Xaa-Pro aminopeptidase